MLRPRGPPSAPPSLGFQLSMVLIGLLLYQTATMGRFTRETTPNTIADPVPHHHATPSKQDDNEDDAGLAEEISPVTPSPSPPAPKPFVVAFCGTFNNQRRGYAPPPTTHLSVISRFFSSHVFPGREVEVRPVTGAATDLPPGVTPTSSEALRLLGLTNDVHVRLCQLGGGAEMSRTLRGVAGARLGTVTWSEFSQRLSKHFGGNHRWGSSGGNKGRWTSDRRSFFPAAGVSVVQDANTKLPVGPLIVRHAMEAWSDGSHEGIGAQIETKRDESVLPYNSLTLYMPNVVYHTAEVFGEDFDKILRRAADWTPANARREHEFFSVMMNSNCGDAVVGIKWPRWCVVRELFTYALHNVTGKPVHNVGRCPLGTQGATRAGITVARREELKTRFAKRPAMTEVFAKYKTPNRDAYMAHKFSLVFENGPSDGYATDRVMNAWQAGSVPVYWGGDVETYADVYNPKAYVHCKFDWKVLPLIQDDAYRAAHGGGENEAWREHVYELLFPSFRACALEVKRLDEDEDAYNRMLGEPIAPMDEHGHVSGVWSGQRMGEMFRDALVGLGYVEEGRPSA